MTREEIIEGLRGIHAVTANYKGDQVILHSMPMTKLTAILYGAAALLEEEAPRVIWLEELEKFKQRREPVFIEYRKTFYSELGVIRRFEQRPDRSWIIIIHGTESTFSPTVKEYLREWRPWSRKPTAAQMKATPWPDREQEAKA